MTIRLDNTRVITSLVGFHDKLISGSEEGTIAAWNMKTGGCEWECGMRETPITSLVVWGDKLVSATEDGIHVWSRDFDLEMAFDTSKLEIMDIIVWRDVLAAVSGEMDGFITLIPQKTEWYSEKHSSRPLRPLYDDLWYSGKKYITVLVSWNDKIFGGSMGGDIYALGESQRFMTEFERKHEVGITSLVIWNDKLVSGDDDGVIVIWDPETKSCEGILKDPRDGEWVTSLAVWDNKLAIRSRSGRVELRTYESGEWNTVEYDDGGVFGTSRLVAHEGKLIGGNGDKIAIYGTRDYDRLMFALCWLRKESPVSWLPDHVAAEVVRKYLI